MEKVLQRLKELADAQVTIEDAEYLTDSVDDYDDEYDDYDDFDDEI